ncbi:MAG: helicase-exonuclease AddAB subunit AddA [Bacillota bacterium]|jgi:ATP-dependent helicase/nuclease subunit A
MMSKVIWTKEQQRAIEEKGCNLLVSAGAGSGKTAVLVERIIRQILDKKNPLSLENILVVTFTNAAASEMRRKIGAAITEMCRQNPHNKHLLRQLSLLAQANITTLHSFCLDLIHRNFYPLGLDASFRVAGQLEQTLLLQETLERFMEEYYQKEDSVLPLLVDSYGGVKDDAQLFSLILELYEFSRSQPHPQAWLDKMAGHFAACQDIDDYPWSDFLLKHLQSEILLAQGYFERARQTAGLDMVLDSWSDLLQAEIHTLGRLAKDISCWKNFLSHLTETDFDDLPRTKEGDKQHKSAVQKIRNQGKKIIQSLKRELCSRSYADLLHDLQSVGVLMCGLSKLVNEFAAVYDEEKRKKGLIDFSDMEHLCLQLLEEDSNGVKEELRQRFTEVLVDEYQDINAVQERILQQVSRGENMFVVGDIKQSIYRFRLAEPKLFLEKYVAYGQGLEGKRVDLNENFRSSQTILKGVNYIFRRLMSQESAGLDYDESVFLCSDKEETGYPLELYLLDNSSQDNKGQIDDLSESCLENALEDMAENSAWQKEAAFIGTKILDLHDKGYAFKDIVILLRSLKNKQVELAEKLISMGIPTVASCSENYLETSEVSLLISILQVIDNPLQDIPLAAVLRSPVIGLDLDQLLALRLNSSGNLYQALQEAAQRYQESSCTLDEIGRKASRFISQLAFWRQQSHHIAITQLIRQIYNDTGFYHLAGALPQGKQRQANLQAFYDSAKEYENSSFKGLLHFLRFIDDAKSRADQVTSNQRMAENEDAVKIMSIHKSKGLEYRIVFLAGLGTGFYLKEKNSDVLWHKDYGLGPKIVQRQKRIKYPTLAHEAIRHALFSESMAEEIRVLYVAMTRAKEKLILTASLADPRRTAEKWALSVEQDGFLPVSVIHKDKRPIDWLARALLNHPNGQALRDLCGLKEKPYSHLSADDSWQIAVVKPSFTSKDDHPVMGGVLEDIVQGKSLPPSEYADSVEQILSYRYPFADICDYAAKITVTQLQKMAYNPQEIIQESRLLIEASAEENKNQAIKKGIAYHWLLQHLPLSGSHDVDTIKKRLQDLVADEIIPSEWLDLIDPLHISMFFAGDLGQRLKASSEAAREMPFIYALPAHQLHKGAATEDAIILQGIIDLVFREADGWVIIDYKSGGKNASAKELKMCYGQQIAYYRRAFAEIMGQMVKECWLYMLEDGRSIKL